MNTYFGKWKKLEDGEQRPRYFAKLSNRVHAGEVFEFLLSCVEALEEIKRLDLSKSRGLEEAIQDVEKVFNLYGLHQRLFFICTMLR